MIINVSFSVPLNYISSSCVTRLRGTLKTPRWVRNGYRDIIRADATTIPRILYYNNLYPWNTSYLGSKKTVGRCIARCLTFNMYQESKLSKKQCEFLPFLLPLVFQIPYHFTDKIARIFCTYLLWNKFFSDSGINSYTFNMHNKRLRDYKQVCSK